MQPTLFNAPAAPLVRPALALALTNAAEALRRIGGERAARCQRDPTCLHAILADALDAIAQGDDATARAEIALLLRLEDAR